MTHHLATTLDDIAAVAGYTATCAIVAWWGGRNLYIPQRVYPAHPVARVIGWPALQALHREWPESHLAIPADPQAGRMRRERQICERLAEGWTPERIAREFDLTPRRVQQLRAELVERGWVEYAEGRRRGAALRMLVGD